VRSRIFDQAVLQAVEGIARLERRAMHRWKRCGWNHAARGFVRRLPLHHEAEAFVRAVVDDFLGMPERPLRARTRVAGVGRGGGVSPPQRLTERTVLDRSRKRAVADLLELAVPAGDRHPDLAPDVGVGRGRDGELDAAERRQVGDRPRRLRARRGRRERARGTRRAAVTFASGSFNVAATRSQSAACADTTDGTSAAAATARARPIIS
jgi:hypothetical protein